MRRVERIRKTTVAMKPTRELLTRLYCRACRDFWAVEADPETTNAVAAQNLAEKVRLPRE